MFSLPFNLQYVQFQLLLFGQFVDEFKLKLPSVVLKKTQITFDRKGLTDCITSTAVSQKTLIHLVLVRVA